MCATLYYSGEVHCLNIWHNSYAWRIFPRSDLHKVSLLFISCLIFLLYIATYYQCWCHIIDTEWTLKCSTGLRYYESHSQDKQCITILLDNIVLINTNYNLYIVSQLLKTIVHTNNGQWLGDKVHTHITWLAVNHEKLLYLLIVLMWHTTVLRISSDVAYIHKQCKRYDYYIIYL